MGILGSFLKSPAERRRVSLDYNCFLADDEVIVDFAIATTPTTDPPLVNDGTYISTDFRSLVTFVSQGKSGSLYQIAMITTTSSGEVKRDDFNVKVA